MIRKLLCFFGFHSWYLDAAIFFRVRRCNYCPATEDKEAARLLDKERDLWKQERGNDFMTTKLNVYGKLASEILARIAVGKQ